MAGEDVLALTQRDRDRLKELHAVIKGRQKVGEAARHLGLSRRQTRRLVRRVEREGDRGVIHRLRGRPSNRTIPEQVRERALALLREERYRDFAPTLAAEHLERIGIRVSRETVRSWQTQAGLWKARRQKIEVVHVWRERRAAFGELVLMDTSDHDWLEGRGPRLYLVAMIDDATSRLWGRFVESDSTEENLRTLRGWLERYGRPLALYTDKNSIFQTAPLGRADRPRRSPSSDRLRGGPRGAAHRVDPGPLASGQGTCREGFRHPAGPARQGNAHRWCVVCDQADRFFREQFLPFWNERFTSRLEAPTMLTAPSGRSASTPCSATASSARSRPTTRCASTASAGSSPKRTSSPACATPASSSSNVSTAPPGCATAAGTCPCSPCPRRRGKSFRATPSRPCGQTPTPPSAKAQAWARSPLATALLNGHFYLAARRTFLLCVDSGGGGQVVSPRARGRRQSVRRRRRSGAVSRSMTSAIGTGRPSSRSRLVTPRPRMPQGTIRSKAREVGRDVEGEAVRRHPAGDADADRADLVARRPRCRSARRRGPASTP